MKKLNAGGFGTLEVLLVIVIAGVIGGAGYFVYDSQRKTNTALDNATKSQGEPQKSEKKEQAKDDEKNKTTQTADYFVIEELGVKFKLSDTLEGLYYHLGNNGNTAYFSLNELKGTDCAADKTAQVALTRYTDEDFIRDELVAPLKENAKKFGDYYYFSMGGQASCSEDPGIQEKASKMRMEIVKILPDTLQQL
jgi:hypothetical protein